MCPLTLDVAELCIEGGKRVPHGHHVRVITPAPGTADARKGALVILLDLGGPEGPKRRYLRHLLNTIQHTYYTTPGTVLSALVYALRTAHQELQNLNDTLAAEEGEEIVPYTCNVACVVLHEDDLYLAQVGATTVAVLLPDGLKWFSPLLHEDEDPFPLGVPRDVRPHTARLSVQPGTMALVLDSGWVGQIDEHAFREAIARPEPQAVLEHLAQSVRVAHVSALALKVVEAPAAPVVTPAPETEVAPSPGEPAPARGQLTPTPTRRARISPWARARHEVGRFLARVLPGQAEPTRERLPPMPEPPPLRPPRAWPLRGRQAPSLGSWKRRLWWGIVLLPILLILVLGFLSWREARQQETAYQGYIAQAQAALAQAATTEDEQVAREYLRQAEEALQAAARLRPDDPLIAQLAGQIRDRRQVVERVQPLYVMWALAPAPGNDPARVFVQENHIYVLDRAGDTVYRYTLDERGEGVLETTPQRLFGRGDLIEGQTVGDLVDMAWLPAGPATDVSGVLALDGAGALFMYDERRGARPLGFARPDGWRAPYRMLVYANKVYVLDRGANALFRFTPSGEGYTLPPDNYFQVDVDLSDVQDVAIDGSVYLVYPNGRLLRYFLGTQKPFTPSVPLGTPTALFTTEALAHLYIADAANARILVLDKETGDLVVQLVPGEGYPANFREIRSLFVSEAEDAIVLLTGDRIWRAPLAIPRREPGGEGEPAAGTP